MLLDKDVGIGIMLKRLVVGPYQANCYILAYKETKECLVIDPGGDVYRIIGEVNRSEFKVVYILITHGHIDHIGGAEELRRITRAPVFIQPLDAPGLNFKPDGNLYDGQKINLGNYRISVLHTPGHSSGGVCFHALGAVFTGDTLFAGSVGRTDFPGGDHHRLIEGVVKRVFPLGDELRVYPGHGPASTIGRERSTNPFFTSRQSA